MDCRTAQDLILDALAEPLARETKAALDSHLAECSTCAAFAVQQRAIDRSMAMAPAPALSPTFRTSLRRRIRQEAASSRWSDSLPDVAHLMGCAAAVAVVAIVAPMQTGAIIAGGAAFTGITFFLQAVLRSFLGAESD